MKAPSLTPLEEAIEALTPNRVNYDICVVYPNGDACNYVAVDVPLSRAADVLEGLAKDLRAAEGPTT